MTEKTPTKAELQGRVDELEARLAELEPRLAEAEAKRDEFLDHARRLAADFDNYRKRAARDQDSLVARAHERLVKELLPVVDDLERALESGAGENQPAAHPDNHARLEEGVRLVERELRHALAREGLVEIATNGHFDPHVHEVLLTQPSEADEGTILQVLQKGYRLGDKIIRPARVVTSAGLPKAAQADE